jgi:competence protein ComFB
MLLEYAVYLLNLLTVIGHGEIYLCNYFHYFVYFKPIVSIRNAGGGSFLMGFKDNYDFDLIVNEVRTLVVDELEKQLSASGNKDICTCQDCVLDMVAYTLNHLKPHYRSSLSFKGVMYRPAIFNETYRNAVEKVVRSAVVRISLNPSHEGNAGQED